MPAQAVVVSYPAVPTQQGTSVYSVTVNGQPVPVTPYNGKSFVWFAFSGTATVQVTVNQTISSYVLSPLRNAVPSTAGGSTLSFTLNQPRKLVLHKVNGLSEELIILADPLESGAPVLGGAGVFNAQSYGADANYNNDATAAIQSAIDAANAYGAGGVAYVPAGHYKLGSTLFLKSNVNLYLAAGAIVQVPVGVGCCFSSSSVLFAADGSNATISGRGVLYGAGTQQSLFFWLLSTENEVNLRMQDVMLLDSQTTAIRLQVNGATLDNLKILSGSKILNSSTWNLSDGTDVDSSQNILYTNNFVLSSDDSVAIGSGGDTRTTIGSNDGFTGTGNLFYHLRTGHTLSIVPYKSNSSTSYTRNILFDNNDTIDTDAVMAIYPFGGMNVSTVTVSNMRVENIRGRPFEIWAGDCTSWGVGNCGQPVGVVGYVHNVKLDHVTFDNFGTVDSQLFTINTIDQVNFNAVTMGGTLLTSPSAMHLEMNGGNVTNVTFTNNGTSAPAGKKLILHDFMRGPTPIPQFIADNKAFLEATPFDGLAVYMRKPDLSMNMSDLVMKNGAQSYSNIAGVLAPIAGQNFTHLTANMGLVFAHKPTDFFNDWSVPIQNFANLAKALKEAGLKGIMFDNEQYDPAPNCWAGYPACVDFPGNSLAAYQAQATLRGKQIMQAMVAQFPDIVIITFHGPETSEPTSPSVGDTSGNNSLYFSGNELMGSFFTGFMEGAAGTAATVVDGSELYCLRTPSDFQTVYSWNKTTLPTVAAFIPPADRTGWPAEISISYGLYDALNCSGSGGLTTPAVMQQITANSLNRADRYVWLYTENTTFLLPPASGGASSAMVAAVANGKAAGAGAPQVSLTKTTDKAAATSGTVVTYTIQYQNIGSGDATNFVIKDAIPTGTTLVAGSITGGGTLSAGTITWTIGTVGAGAPAASVSFKVTVN